MFGEKAAIFLSDNIRYNGREEMEKLEELTFTSFAQMDQDKDVSFSIKKVSGAIGAADLNP